MESTNKHIKILVIQTASIGDVILSTAALESLREKFPEGTIDILVKGGCESLFLHHPFLRQVLVWDKSHKKYRNLLAIKRRIRKERYSAVITFQRFASSGFLTAFSRAPIKAGFSKNPFSFLFSHKVPHSIDMNQAIHETERNRRLISFLTGDINSKMALYPGKDDEEAVSNFSQNPFITISPLSLWFTKQWPIEKWHEFIHALPDGIRVFILGSGAERKIIEQEFSGDVRLVNLAGRLTLLQTAALMKKALMNFTNDSAPLHLASAVNAPVTAIFCSTVPGFGFGPMSDDSMVIETEEILHCRPCGLHGRKSCPEKNMKCGMNIPKEKLLNRIQYAG